MDFTHVVKQDSGCECGAALHRFKSSTVMAQHGPDAKTESAQLESPGSAAGSLQGTAGSSAVFDEFELAQSSPASCVEMVTTSEDADRTPRAFEAEEGGPSPTSQSQEVFEAEQGQSSANSGRASDGKVSPVSSPPAGRVSLQQLLGLSGRVSRSQDTMNADRVEISSPQHEGRAMRSSMTTKTWMPFTLLGCGTVLNWVTTFAIGASWQEHGHRYYFFAAFVSSLVVHTWQGIQLAEILEGSAAAVMMECTVHLRVVLGVVAAWFGLVPVVLAYTTLREGIDSNAFVVNFNSLSFYVLVGNSIPLCLLFVFIGVHEAWLDLANPRFSAVLSAAVIATLFSAGTTVFSWEAASRNQRSAEVFYDAAFSICKLYSSTRLQFCCALLADKADCRCADCGARPSVVLSRERFLAAA
eukprot:COSAG02_NODE_387_length_23294_cov_52.630610_9_plen_413_part_00